MFHKIWNIPMIYIRKDKWIQTELFLRLINEAISYYLIKNVIILFYYYYLDYLNSWHLLLE